MNLSNKALIVTLSTGAWRASKLHKAETAKVNNDHHAIDLARVTVKLTSHPALEALGKLHAEARAAHYRLTLPAADDGFRLLPCGRELEHADLMAAYRAKHEALAAEYIAAYDEERVNAPARLNGLYDPAHWPINIANKFRFTTKYLPCPNTGTWADWMAESAESGREELRERLAIAIRHFATKTQERVTNPKAIFRDSLSGNLADIVDLAKDLNMADDPAIESLRLACQPLARVNPDALRDDKEECQRAAREADRICKAFNL